MEIGIDRFTQDDIPFIRGGSQDFNERLAEVSETVRIALGLVEEESLSLLRQGELVMELLVLGIKWEVRKERKKLQACAFRQGSQQILYDSQQDVKTPFEEVDSLQQGLSAFLNEMVKRFPTLYSDLRTLRSSGQATLLREGGEKASPQFIIIGTRFVDGEGSPKGWQPERFQIFSAPNLGAAQAIVSRGVAAEEWRGPKLYTLTEVGLK